MKSGRGELRSDLVIVGGGSAAFAAALKAEQLGATAIMINDGLPIGGTCVNVGCVPSKTLIRAAEAVRRACHTEFAGIRARGRLESFAAVVQQKRQLVADLRSSKYVDVLANLKGCELVPGRARFVGPRTVEVGGTRIHGERVIVATGARPALPPIAGLDSCPFLTNETAFELECLPASMIVLGGRYVALECAQMFARFGTRVTLLQRSPRILPDEAADLTDALAAYLGDEGIELHTGVRVQAVQERDGAIVVGYDRAGRRQEARAEKLLLATGRRPNTEGLCLQAAGVSTDEGGFIVVDETLATSAPGVYAAGDVIGSPMFVYTAAYEGSLAAANALSDSAAPRSYDPLPWVVFTDPQVAGVGLDEQQADKRGLEVEVSALPLTHVPRALAARDTRGMVKLVRRSADHRLVGARILAAEGSELLMQLSLAIRGGLRTEELAEMFHPYLTLSEAVKLAAIAFDKPVEQLSCCAS